jgi:acylphosphatase
LARCAWYRHLISSAGPITVAWLDGRLAVHNDRFASHRLVTMPTPSICQHLRILGVVQGVGFRASLESTARTLQLAGWVRNCRDGSVEAVVQGTEPAVEALVAWCRRGPPAARVDAVHNTARPLDPELTALHCVASA